MYLTADKVVNGMVCAQKVLEDKRVWGGNSDYFPISVDAAKEVIEELSGYSVKMRSTSFEAAHIFARVEKYIGKRAEIDVRHNLSDQWKRFVASKELLHLIIDQDEDMSPYGDETLDNLVRDGHIGVISQNGDRPPAQSELIAEVAAIELLFPIQNRDGDLQAFKRGETSVRRLSIKYGIPENFIETAFDDGYLAVLKKAVADQAKQNAQRAT